MVREREDRKSRDIVMTGDGRGEGGVLLVCWDVDGRQPGGRMILYIGRIEEDDW